MFRFRSKIYKPWLEVGGGAMNDSIPRRPRKRNARNGRRGQAQNVEEGQDQAHLHQAQAQRHNDMDMGHGEQRLQCNSPEPDDQMNLAILENNTMCVDDSHSEVDHQSSDDTEEEQSSEGGHDSDNDEVEQCRCLNCEDEALAQQEDGELGFKEAEGYAAKLDLHEPLSAALNVSKFDTLLMILTITMRHGMTGPLVQDLLKFVNIIVGTQALPPSNHIFQKIFSVTSELTFHFICEGCNLYLGKHKSFETSETECTNCNTICNVRPSTLSEGTFFVTLSIRDQMQELLQRNSQHIMPRRDRGDEVIADVHDGEIYKSLSQEGMPLNNPYALTVTLGTDGGQVFQNSGKNSMWPCEIICNEIISSERFRPENMILGGLWFGKNSPEMSAFLRPISDELKSMETEGIKRTLSNGDEIECPVFAIMCVCDSVAKPKLQNISQFNAYFGCGYCLQKGELIDNLQVRFPFNGKKYKLRSEESVRNAMTVASEIRTVEEGVKGHSALLLFSTIHLIFGIPIDYMHCVLLGCVKRLVGLWFDESSTGMRYYMKRFETEIDSILENIAPPSKTTSRPKAISKRSSWKAKDWGNFLLFFGLPSLEKFLPSIYLENFRDLSNGIFLFLQDSITYAELEQGTDYILRFTQVFNNIYGKKNMVYNVHLLTHLPDIVKMCGPLSKYSAFSFESGIGLLVKLVKGTNSVASQICKKFLVSKTLPYLLSKYNITPSVQEFCQETLSFTRNKKSLVVDGVTLLGGEKLHMLGAEERHLLISAGYFVPEYVVSYNRAIFKGKVFASRAYDRPKKTNDTCVQLSCGSYGLVDLIIYISEPRSACLIIFTPVRICPNFGPANHIFICAGNPYAPKALFNFMDIVKKCIFFTVNSKKYVTYRPNEFERDL